MPLDLRLQLQWALKHQYALCVRGRIPGIVAVKRLVLGPEGALTQAARN